MGVPSAIWDRILGQERDEDGKHIPPLPLLWFERATPLYNDITIAVKELHCLPSEYYARSTPRERLLLRLYYSVQHARDEMRQAQEDRVRESTPPPTHVSYFRR